MIIYDTANKLAQEIKQSEEYINYKMAKETLNLNTELKNKIKQFEEIRYNVQVEVIQTGKHNKKREKSLDKTNF